MKALVMLMVLGASVYLDAVVLPSDFKKCDYSNLKGSQCLRKNIEDAIHKLTRPYPDVNLPSLDPLELEHYKIVINNSKVIIEEDLSNVKVKGYTNVKIRNLEANFVGENVLVLDLFFPIFEITGDYKLKGKLLGRAIEGEGIHILRFERLKANQTFHFEETSSKSSIQARVIKSELILDTESGHVELQNIFNGDKIKSDELNNAMNDNFQDIFNACKTDLGRVYAEIHKTIFNKFLQKVSVTEIFENYKMEV